MKLTVRYLSGKLATIFCQNTIPTGGVFPLLECSFCVQSGHLFGVIFVSWVGTGLTFWFPGRRGGGRGDLWNSPSATP